jgi:ribulose-phosphate 3-epimerase
MALVCPTVLAADKTSYHDQMAKVAGFAHRIQIDLTDGVLAKSPTVMPDEAWWPIGVKADFHLMYKQPSRAVDVILEHKPHMIIVHAESSGRFIEMADKLHGLGVFVGVALLPQTTVETITPALDHIDHVLIFSGDLGNFGGHANLRLLDKVAELRRHKPELEIGWDGGINEQNISKLVFAGVDVLNVGGYIQNAEEPEKAYSRLVRIAEETGTT